MNLKTEKDKTLGPLAYFIWGSLLMLLKYNIDRAVAWWGFGRTWYFWNYIKPHGLGAVDAIPPDDEKFYLILLLASLPFLIAGIVLTLRRLRSAGLPLALCLLFFVPVINLIFFAVLCVIPARTAPASPERAVRWMAWLPSSAPGSAVLAMVIVGLVGSGLAYLGSTLLQEYGWGLFVGLPFAMGFTSVLIYAARQPRDIWSCIGVALLPVLFTGIVLLLIAVEGLICLIMAAPIALFLALLGGLVAYVIVGRRPGVMSPAAMSLVLLAVPFSMSMEKQAGDEPPTLSVTSSVIIDAPPEKVWPNVVAFSPIPDERDWVLHTGVAYPTRARIDGQGVGAIRHCIFTTGEFVEPIQVWDENRLLHFSVAQQPEPMEEMSPYPRLKTPHLDGYFRSSEGELRLTSLPGGRTLLSGTTWYTDRIWPSRYWQLWSDTLIHHIHLRVLNHIKNLSEK
jgi:uncharacterized membrane protein YhaH (DUF805 family)